MQWVPHVHLCQSWSRYRTPKSEPNQLFQLDLNRRCWSEKQILRPWSKRCWAANRETKKLRHCARLPGWQLKRKGVHGGQSCIMNAWWHDVGNETRAESKGSWGRQPAISLGYLFRRVEEPLFSQEIWDFPRCECCFGWKKSSLPSWKPCQIQSQAIRSSKTRIACHASTDLSDILFFSHCHGGVTITTLVWWTYMAW